MEKHTEVLQKDIGGKKRQPAQIHGSRRQIHRREFLGHGVRRHHEPVSGGNVKKGAAIYNILVYKPGLYSNNQSIVVGANYDSSGRRNNGLRNGPAAGDGKRPERHPHQSQYLFCRIRERSGARREIHLFRSLRHAGTLSGSIGATNILGMINLEPQKLDAGGSEKSRARKPPGKPFCSQPPRTARNLGQCAAPFAKSWEQAPTTFYREPSALTGNDRHYAVLGIPTVSCRASIPSRMPVQEEYVQALTDMIHQIADNDAPEPAKNAGQGEKAS